MGRIITSAQSSGSEGTLTVIIPSVYGNSTFYGVISEPTYNNYTKSFWIGFRSNLTTLAGTSAYILSALIILSIFMIALTQKQASLIFVIVGVGCCIILGILKMTTLSFVGIITLAVMIIYKISRRGDYGLDRNKSISNSNMYNLIILNSNYKNKWRYRRV